MTIMASLNLDALTATDAPLPVSKRGREAAPIPENIATMISDSYDLPKGSGKTMRVPNADGGGEKDVNVKAVVALLRRAATKAGHGLTVSIGEANKSTTIVQFRAKDKTKRRTKAEREYDALVQEWRAEFTDNADAYADVESVEDVEGWDDMSAEQQSAVEEAWTEVFVDEADDLPDGPPAQA